MAGFTCPYCGMVMSLDRNTMSTYHPCFEFANGMITTPMNPKIVDSTIEVVFYKCPNCNSYTIAAKGIGKSVDDFDTVIRPYSLAKKYPSFVPQQIRTDYEEACAVLKFSPKASATLSRRCLQGMIRDFWKITKSNLYEEITALKDQVQPDLWQALNDLRQLGNIGAHMEKDTSLIIDIDPGEAELLIQLIELLVKEWYINRQERSRLFGDIFKVNTEKQAQRKGEG